MYFVLQLIVDILFSWARMFIALFLSIIFSVFVGIAAATNRKAESIILPAIDVLQTIPILGFFPVVIYLVVLFIPSYIGINIAVIFLIFTSMAWNITFGVYEAIKSIPNELREVAQINHLSKFQEMKSIYVPAAMPRIAYQSSISWAVGLFYLVTSEIFSTGSKNFAVKYGIGTEIANLVLTKNLGMYILAIVFFIIAVLLTRALFLGPLSVYSERFSFKEEQRATKRSRVLAFYTGVGRIIARFIPRIQNGVRVQSSTTAKKKAHKEVGKGISSGAVSAVFILVMVAASAIAVLKANAYAYVPVLFTAMLFSFVRVWGMYIVCVAIAIPLGIRIAKSARAYEPVLAVLETIASVPATILLPAIVALLYVLPFGNELTALAIIFLAMIWYLLFSVISGMRTIPEQFNQLLSIFRTDWVRAWREVYIPAMLPSFVTGSITAIGGAWNALIVAEYFSIEASGGSTVLTQVGSGIGKLLDVATFQGNLLLMFLALASMVVMVMIINKLVWQRLYRNVTHRYRIEM